MAQRTPKAQVTSRWEWVAGALSMLVILGLLAVLVHGATRPRRTAEIAVHVDSVGRASAEYRVRFTADNAGTETARAVVIEGSLWTGDARLETSTATLDYLPGGGRRQGVLFFTRDPAAHALRLRASGYEVP